MARRSTGLHKEVVVLDTSVLIHDPHCIEKFGLADVVIPIFAIEELDKKKSQPNGVGASAREATRRISRYSDGGSLKEGIQLDSGGWLRVDCRGSLEPFNVCLNLERSNDNMMLTLALQLQAESKNGNRIKFISKDLNLLLKANALGLLASDYTHDKLLDKLSDLYSGHRDIAIPESMSGLLQELYMAKSAKEPGQYIKLETLNDYVDGDELVPNQCCKLICGPKYSLTIYNRKKARFELIPKPKNAGERGLGPVNDEQAFAYHLLTSTRLPIVTLTGRAGTGKTLLALLAADKMVDAHIHEDWHFYSSTIPVGQDLGYLPGDMNEKFAPYAQGLNDNYWLIFHAKNPHKSKLEMRKELYEGNAQGAFHIGPINYSRGRSIAGSYMIIDEAQNMTPHQIKTMVTRAGKNTKLVIIGDPEQIDNKRFLDETSNGLTYLVERFKGQDVFGHITLEKSERSELAELGSRLL